MDTPMYSNAMLAMNFEIPADRVGLLVSRLQAAGLSMTREDAPETDAPDDPRTGVVPGSLSVKFIHDDPELRIEVPAVPG